MEQKLAEFRARRQAENAVKKNKSPDPQTAAAQVETTPPCESEQTEEEADNSGDAPESSGSQVRKDMRSCCGCLMSITSLLCRRELQD